MPEVTLPQRALQAIGDTSPIVQLTPLSGGMISRAQLLQTRQGSYFLKTDEAKRPGFFAAEAKGLQLIAASNSVRVPQVLAVSDDFLLLEWISSPAHPDSRAAVFRLGQQIAALHHSSAPAYGLDTDGYIGIFPQPNGWYPSWITFFREQRLQVQLELAARHGHLTNTHARRMERVMARLGEWIDESQVQPALIHGDLWNGNWLIDSDGAPAVVDPAAYYGDREAEIAYTALFSGFPQPFYTAYEEISPLAPGWEDRRAIYNLYHLVNHLNHFGESYGSAVDAVLQRYGS